MTASLKEAHDPAKARRRIQTPPAQPNAKIFVYRVYVLQNAQSRFYIGISDDADRRIGQHNRGESRWTKAGTPWTCVWKSKNLSLSDARKLEILLKRQKGGAGFYRLIG